MKRKWVICSTLMLGCLVTSTRIVQAEKKPVIQYQQNSGFLFETQKGRTIKHQLMPFFAVPEQYNKRWQDIQLYFNSRFGIHDPMNYELKPQIIVLHSTESEGAAGVYQTFAHGSESQYLGGVWTHFLVDQQGIITQYSPLNRVSKGQAGANDLAVGIEILGFASSYRGEQRLKVGSIAHRYATGQTAQLEAVADLVASLQQTFMIPERKIYSHQELAMIGKLSGTNPDYDWLRKNIKDRVYLGETPDLSPNGQPGRKYGFLQPYGRTDPGIDIMQTVKGLLEIK